MRYYKFLDEHNIEEYTKKYVIVDGRQISHPSAETLLKAGIKPLVVEDMPELTDAQCAEPYYVDGDSQITQKWNVVEVIDDETTDA